jgi:hypothetical protein
MEVNFYQNGKGLENRQWAFKPLLFQSMAFVRNQFPEGGYVSFTLESGGEIYGIIHFFIDNGDWVSMPKSPFGGVSVAQEVNEPDVRLFANAILRKAEGGPLTVYLPYPGYPSTAGSWFSDSLREAGFAVAFQDTQQYIDVSVERSLSESMHDSQLRRLAKCEKAGFVFAAEPYEHLAEIYSFIETCRTEQSIPLNISLEGLRKSWVNMKGSYNLFVVRDREEVIAACITVTVSREVLYYFLPAASAAYSRYSPMVMLIFNIYKWAQKSNYKLIDLGRASIKGKVQEGLREFKGRMGGVEGYSVCLRNP